MALQLDREKLCCFICSDLLKDPATTPCGHSFCMSCLKIRWDEKDPGQIYSCPLCKQTFRPRPAAVRNVVFADLVEELKMTRLLGAPADYAKPEDVPCDFCTEKKLKAMKSCLVCRVSYCGFHVQPHYKSSAFEKHKLVEPSGNLLEKFCSSHDEVMKLFCRTDQQSICIFCSLDEHKDHVIVSAAAERNVKSRELRTSRENIQRRIQAREKSVKMLQKEMKAIKHSTDKAVKDSEEIFSELVNLIQNRLSNLKEQIRSKQTTEISRVKKLVEEINLEIAELKMKDAELEQLSNTNDHIQFLLKYPSLSRLTDSADLPSLDAHALQYFEGVSAAVSEARVKLQDILNEEWSNIGQKVLNVDVLLPQPEPRTREEFLQYSRQITLDPNTVNAWLALTDRNRKATVMRQKQSYSSHPDRFTDKLQVLSKESLIGRCYWEVERSSGVSVTVAYKDISRAGTESGSGNNDRSWAFGCFDISCYFRHSNSKTLLSGPQCQRIGLYLDHKAGTLSFYSVSDSMTLLHKVQAAFSQPLHAGLWIYWAGDTAELCELRSSFPALQ